MNIRTQIEERVRAVGLKLTPQRYAILDFLVRSREHPTADKISLALNRRFPRASRATIYNTLNALRDAGLVHEVYLDDAVARFDANLDRHHHFVCRVCDKLEDVPFEEVGELPARKLERGHRVENYEIVMRGVCAACQRREK
ncbi:MAG: transcriptional repressor [Acidobacteria bacterium]|nr:transcriptional repressor [Acidobacteriota bacterium]